MTFWTPERHDEAVRLRERGMSAARIAAELHTSRNSVISRLTRKGIMGAGTPRVYKNDPTRRNPDSPRNRKPVDRQVKVERHGGVSKLTGLFVMPDGEARPAAKSAAIVPDAHESVQGRVAIWDLRAEHCRWVFGDPKDVEAFRYCGVMRHGSSSYCAVHHKVSYVGKGAW